MNKTAWWQLEVQSMPVAEHVALACCAPCICCFMLLLSCNQVVNGLWRYIKECLRSYTPCESKEAAPGPHEEPLESSKGLSTCNYVITCTLLLSAHLRHDHPFVAVGVLGERV